jgi:kynurenine formamidase
LTRTATSALLAAVADGVTTVELGQPLFTGMPCSPNHPGFRMSLSRRHGDAVRPDGGSAASEVLITGGHVGTHIDALAHVSHDGRLHGGVDAAAAQRGGTFSEHGAERIPPLITRGVLLDVAGTHGADVLEPGYGVTEADLVAASQRAGVVPGPGDVALVRTGWARHFSDARRYLGHDSGVPGVTESAARWLANRGVVATGADTTAYERIPAGQGHRVLPVHRLLLVEHGIYIIEHLDLEAAAGQGLTEFLFVLLPLRIVGGTGSPVRPVAVVAGEAVEERVAGEAVEERVAGEAVEDVAGA